MMKRRTFLCVCGFLMSVLVTACSYGSSIAIHLGHFLSDEKLRGAHVQVEELLKQNGFNKQSAVASGAEPRTIVDRVEDARYLLTELSDAMSPVVVGEKWFVIVQADRRAGELRVSLNQIGPTKPTTAMVARSNDLLKLVQALFPEAHVEAQR